MVAVTTALVKTRTAKIAARPATVRRAFKARITDTHVFYAARSADKTAAAAAAFPACISCGQAQRCLNLGLERRLCCPRNRSALQSGLFNQSLRSQRLPRQSEWCRPCFVPTGL